VARVEELRIEIGIGIRIRIGTDECHCDSLTRNSTVAERLTVNGCGAGRSAAAAFCVMSVQVLERTIPAAQ